MKNVKTILTAITIATLSTSAFASDAGECGIITVSNTVAGTLITLQTETQKYGIYPVAQERGLFLRANGANICVAGQKVNNGQGWAILDAFRVLQ